MSHPDTSVSSTPARRATRQPATGVGEHADTGEPKPQVTHRPEAVRGHAADHHAARRPESAGGRQTAGTVGFWSDRGSATLELAVLAPGLILLIALIALAGRYAIADGAVDQAAAEAARAASLQRTPSAGRDAAAEVARSALTEQGLSCLRTEIDVDVSGLRAPPGQRGRVAVTVRCPLRVADLPLPVPAITLAATAVSPVDTYRER